MNKSIRTTKLATRIVVSICILLSTVVLNRLQAQLTGTKNIPGDYPTLVAAIADLNVQGVGAGGVTFNLLAGNPQSVPAGGYVIGGVGSAILTGPNATSATKKVIFQGNLNILTASSALAAGNLNDGIFKLIGADWITIQGFNMQENAANVINTPAASNNMTEWGVALLYVSLTDGSQNNTIQNNTIALNRNYQNSFGIYSNVRHSATDVITLADITDPTTGPNSNNKVYTNSINNVNIGIVFIGSGTAANMDNANDLGGASLATGNNITNYGGLGALSAYNSLPTTIVIGAYLLNENNVNLSFNSFISASLNTAVALRGILTDYSAVPIGAITNNVNSNTVTFTNAGVGGFQCITTASTAGIAANVIQNLNQNLIINNAVTGVASAVTIFGVANLGAFGTANLNFNIVRANTSTATTGGLIGVTQQGAVINTANLNNNQIGDAIAGAATFTAATTAQINPILNTAAAATATVNINNNIIRGFSVVATGQVTAVSNQAATVGVAINIKDNQIGTAAANCYTYSAASAGAFVPIFNSNGAATALLTITGNDVRGIVNTVVGSGAHSYIVNQTFTGSCIISNNTFTNIVANTTGSVTFIANSISRSATATCTVNNNSVVGTYNKPGAGGTILFYNSFGVSPITASETNTGNNFSNMTFTGAATITGWRCSDGTGVTGCPKTVTNNTFSNIVCGTAAVNILQCSFGTTGTITGNVITNVTAAAAITAFTSSAGANNNISQNTITGLSSTVGAVIGLSITGAAPSVQTVTRNKIGNLQSINATGTVNGILVSGGTTVNLINNLIGDLRTPITSSTVDAIRGINITSTTAPSNVNVYYNTININAQSTGANFHTSGLFHTFSTTATTATLDMRNNVIVNNSTANGTGLTVAFRRSANTNLNNYATTSNNNLFWAGGVGACTSRFIYYDGTTGLQLAAFKALVTPRESASVSEDPRFISTTATAATFLHIDPSIPTQIESGAATIGTVTNDFDGDVRSGTPDIGADEFSGIVAIACTGTPTAGTATAVTSTICNGLSATICLGGQTPPLDVTIQWKSSLVSGGPYTDVVCANANCYTTGPLTPGTYYFVAVVTCANSGLSATSNQVTVTVIGNPIAAVTPSAPNLCLGSSVTLTASGGTTYLWSPSTGLNTTSGPVVSASPSVSTTYTVTVTDINGCSATATSTITVLPAPTVTATATPASICSGGSSQLNALACLGIPSSSYTLSSLTGQTYTPLTGGGITIINTNAQLTPTFGDATEDDGGIVVTLPFVFTYNCNTFTQMSMSTNGWVGAGNQGTIDAANSRAPGNFFTTTIPNNTIAAWFKDMGANFPLGTGSMRHGLIGTGVYAFQWDNAVGSGFSDGSTILVSFQVNIYGPTSVAPGRVELIYGPTVGAIAFAASQGIEDAIGGPTHFINAINGSNTLTTMSTVWPGNGNGYRFEPLSPTYAWSPSTFLNNTGISNPLATGVTTTTTYTVTVSSANGCSSTASVTVNANPTITITETDMSGIANNDGIICAGSSATLTASGGVTYLWSSGSNTASTTVSPLVTTIYTVTVTDAAGCSATASSTITVTPFLSLNPVVTQPTTCVSTDGAITLNPIPEGTYIYDWADIPGTSNSQNRTGLMVGNYNVSVTNPATGCVTTLAIFLAGPGGCDVCPTITNLTVTPNPVCANNTITFSTTGLTNMGVTYGIQFKSFPAATATPYVGGTVLATVPNTSLTGGGTAATATATIAVAGTYFIYAVLTPVPTDPQCRPSATTTPLVVNPIPNAVATPPSQTICSGATITTIVLSGNVPNTTFNWTRNNTATVTGIAASGSGNISGSLTNTTNAPVTVTFTITPTANGCPGTPITATVLVNPTPIATVTPPSQTICSGNAITTIVLSGNVTGSTFNWTRDNVATVTGIPASGSGNISGTLTNTTGAPVTVTFTITPTATSCPGGSITATVTVNPSPVVNPVANKIFCFHTLVPSIVFNSSAPNATINWVQTGANIGLAQASGTGFIPSFLGVNNTNGPLTATFTVTATFTNGGVTCTGPPMVFTITICYQMFPVILGDTYVCPGQTVTYTVGTANPNSTYTWLLQNGGGVILSQNSSSITIQWQNNPGGPFSLQLKETGCTNTCSDYAFAQVFVQGVEALACNDHVQISLDTACLAHVLSGMILEGENENNNNYYVELYDASGNLIPNAILTSAYLGQLITAKVVNECQGNDNSCWGTITLEDKIPPTIACQNSTVTCGSSLEPIYIAPISGLASVIKTPLSPIGPNAGTVTTENINMLIPTGGLVQDVNVTVDLDHTFSGDLKVDLISPAGTIINLATSICGAADNWDNVTFDDQALIPIANACNNTPPPAILAGSYIPTQSLGTFNGEEAGGIWQLRITDQANGDAGILNLVKLDVLYQESGPFAPVTSDACGDVDLSYSDSVTGDPCEAQILTRHWTASDESGNTATCDQILTIVPLQLANVIFPPAFIGECGESDLPDHTGWPTTIDGIILTDANNVCNLFIGYWDQAINDCGGGHKIARHWSILDWCTVQTRQFIQVIKLSDTQPPVLTCPNDFEVGTDFWYCYANVSVPKPGVVDNCSDIANYLLTSSDGTVVGFGNNFVINGLGLGTHTVTWRVTDECGNSSTCSFHITVVDDVVPVANCDQHTVISLSNDGPQGITLIPATVFNDGSYDNCGPVTFRARRMDSCIDIDWTTEGACIDDTPGGVPPVNSRDRGTVHRPCVPFACCDVGAGPIMVELEVTDLAGNKNYCMVEAIVQDKISPFVECPPDIIVSCDFWFNVQEGTFVDETGNNNGNLDEDPLSPVFGNMYDAFEYNDDQSVRQDIIINDPGSHIQPQPHFWGIDGWADDNCEVNLQVRVRIVADCSGGDLPANAPDGAVKMIERRFSAIDGTDGVAPGTCTQRIWVVDYNPFFITDNTCNNNNPNDGVIWPCDVLLTDCPEDLGDTGEPTVFDDACSLVGVTYEDTRFDFVDSACFKILRDWSIIDWCQYNSLSGAGLWHYIQVIKVHDNQGPAFTDCPTGPVTLCVADEGVSLPDNNQAFLGEENPLASSCSVHLNLHRTVHETCSDIVNYDVKLYLNNGDEFIYLKTTTTVPVDENNNADLSFDTRTNPVQSIRLNGIPYNSPFCGDYHRILWSAEDGCGNWSHCEYLIRLEDCKLPSPVCINGLSSVVMPVGGQVTVWAKDFNASSFDDCTAEADLLYSFSGDSYQPSFTYTCDNVPSFHEEFAVQIWVADGGTDDNCNGQISWNERNKDFCTTSLLITDNAHVCDTIVGPIVNLAGSILTEDTQPVQLVSVTLSSPGHIFPVFVTTGNGAYEFTNLQVPADCQVTALRDDDHRNGVSTLDLVQIQKHLLGIQPFTDPYQLIAADANNSQSVSAIDLVELRKLILGIYTKLPLNTSWRFVDKSFQFVNPAHPWPFDEVIDVPNMTGSELGKDFMAVKIGDVNNSVKANLQQIKPRTGDGVLHLTADDRNVTTGETVNLAIHSDNFTAIEGYQFTMMTSGLEFVGVESGVVEMNDENIGSFGNMLTTSWHKVGGVSTTSSDVLFTLHFRAIGAGHLSEMIKLNSKVTEAEAYNTSDDIKDVKLSFRGAEGAADFALYQNEPNPFKNITVIGYDVPQSGDVTLTIFDVTGKILKVKNQNAVKGYNTLSISSKELPSVGVMYYRLDAGEYSATKKMVLIQ